MTRIPRRLLTMIGALAFTGSALAQYAYISTSNANSPNLPQLAVINTVTNTLAWVVSLGPKGVPGGVAVNPSGTRAYIAVTNRLTNNLNIGTVSVVDTASNTVTATIGVGNAPLGVVVNPAGTRAYVANVGSGNVSVIDTATNTVIATVDVDSLPYGIAINPAGTRVYVTGPGGSVSVIDTATNTVIAKVNVGTGPYGVVVNPAGTLAYVTVGVSGSVSNPGKDTVAVIDTATNTVTATITGLAGPKGVAVNPAGTRVYVANGDSNTVSVIDTATNTVTATINVGSNSDSLPATVLKPYAVSVNPAGTRLYIANYSSNIVSVIDTATNSVTASINMGALYAPDLFGIMIGGPTISASINSGGVVNSASYAANMPVAPGSIASLFGTFPVSTAAATTLPLPSTLSSMTVQFNGVPAPFFFTSSTQANVQIPWELPAQTSTSVAVTVGGKTTTQKFNLTTFAPGVFAVSGTGQGQGIIADAVTGELISPSHPAHVGSTVVVYATGLGPVANQPITGNPASTTVLSRTTTTPTVALGSSQADVLFSGLAPGYVGLYQINVQVPFSAPIGDSVPLVVSIGGATSNVVTVAIQH